MISEPQVLVIDGKPSSFARRIKEILRYRELLFFLAWRDFKVRYKQTVLGAAWAILQPVCTMAVFSIFFGYLGNIPSDGLPYPIFTYCALLPWSLFAYIVTESSNSLISNQALITKVYFPRLIIPMAPVFVGLVDFAIAMTVLVGLMLFYGISPGIEVLTLPFFVLFAVIAALTVGIWLSALNAQYRDIRYTIPFVTQLWLFATPVAYPSSFLPEPWRTLYGLNPMAGVVEGFRWALLGHARQPGAVLAVSIGTVLVLLTGGLWYFSRMERTFADIV